MTTSGSKRYWFPLLVYSMVVMISGLCLELCRVVDREELQQINKLFELRYWLRWNDTSLARLNPHTLWHYHESHEIPRQWWAWDYTLSWLIESNHRRPAAKVVVFNHLPEDEPPLEAVSDHPWMVPLLHQPLHRKVVAGFVHTLALAGAKVIVLDNDFPQYSDDDAELASTIHDCTTGSLTGRPVPVFMVKSIYRKEGETLSIAQSTTAPNGVLSELQRLEPGVDVSAKYTATACLYADLDQVVRRCVLRMPSISDGDSIVLKALEADGIRVDKSVPDILDIDFESPASSGIIPVRPLSYLLDPERRSALLKPSTTYWDIRPQDSIVIIGDGMVDTFNTPLTNHGTTPMSGSEILAQAMDTVSAGAWLKRLPLAGRILALVLMVLMSAPIFCCFRIGVPFVMRRKLSGVSRILIDIIALIGIIFSWQLLVGIGFTYARILLPLVVPQLSAVLGFLACAAWEREHERATRTRERLVAATNKYESELRVQQAEARLRELMMDKERRREFVRRVNHDLKAPLTVINWNLAKLQSDGIQSKSAPAKVNNVMRTADRLFDLMDELTKSYENEPSGAFETWQSSTCHLASVLNACVQMGESLAEIAAARIDLLPVDANAYAGMNAVDLSRVMDNLIKNALTHNPPGVHITVSAETSAPYHIIRVSDTGNGIPQEHLPHIFDNGYRVSPQDGKGSGLGLNIVKALVESAGGQVSIVSTIGIGTTILLAIVAADTEALPAAVKDANPDDSARICLVEEACTVDKDLIAKGAPESLARSTDALRRSR